MAGKKEPEYVRFINKIREDCDKMQSEMLPFGYTDAGLKWFDSFCRKMEKIGICEPSFFSAYMNNVYLEWICDEEFINIELDLKTRQGVWWGLKRPDIDFTPKNINQGMQQLKKEVDAFYAANMPKGNY